MKASNLSKFKNNLFIFTLDQSSYIFVISRLNWDAQGMKPNGQGKIFPLPLWNECVYFGVSSSFLLHHPCFFSSLFLHCLLCAAMISFFLSSRFLQRHQFYLCAFDACV